MWQYVFISLVIDKDLIEATMRSVVKFLIKYLVCVIFNFVKLKDKKRAKTLVVCHLFM